MARRQKRDAFLEEAFISADMALVWVNVDSQYLAQELAEQIASVVHKRTHAQKVVGRLI